MLQAEPLIPFRVGFFYHPDPSPPFAAANLRGSQAHPEPGRFQLPGHDLGRFTQGR